MTNGLMKRTITFILILFLFSASSYAEDKVKRQYDFRLGISVGFGSNANTELSHQFIFSLKDDERNIGAELPIYQSNEYKQEFTPCEPRDSEECKKSNRGVGIFLLLGWGVADYLATEVF